MKNVFNWLIRKQNTAEEISELDAMTIETSKIEKKKRLNKTLHNQTE